jgi:hypothetical protein
MQDDERAEKLLKRLKQGPCTMQEACLTIDNACSPNGWIVMGVQLNKHGWAHYNVLTQVFSILPGGLEYLEELKTAKAD